MLHVWFAALETLEPRRATYWHTFGAPALSVEVEHCSSRRVRYESAIFANRFDKLRQLEQSLSQLRLRCWNTRFCIRRT